MKRIMEGYYAIKLISKYTGEETYLGSKYKTHKAATRAAKNECMRCNTFSIYRVDPDAVYINRKQPLSVRMQVIKQRLVRKIAHDKAVATTFPPPAFAPASRSR